MKLVTTPICLTTFSTLVYQSSDWKIRKQKNANLVGITCKVKQIKHLLCDHSQIDTLDKVHNELFVTFYCFHEFDV